MESKTKNAITANLIEITKIKDFIPDKYSYECLIIFKEILNDLIESNLGVIKFRKFLTKFREYPDCITAANVMFPVLIAEGYLIGRGDTYYMPELNNQIAYYTLGNKPDDTVLTHKYVFNSPNKLISKSELLGEYRTIRSFL